MRGLRPQLATGLVVLNKEKQNARLEVLGEGDQRVSRFECGLSLLHCSELQWRMAGFKVLSESKCNRENSVS